MVTLGVIGEVLQINLKALFFLLQVADWKMAEQGGGFVFNSAHNIQARIPKENLIALVEASRAFR
jgi:hypothetical protein